MSRIPLPPYPNGWFAVGHSDALAPGEVRAVHYLGRDLVVYRGEDGRCVEIPYAKRIPPQAQIGRAHV